MWGDEHRQTRSARADPGGRGRCRGRPFRCLCPGRDGQFDVTHTFDPAVALRLASSEPWDLVLTDVEMPGMTGLQLLEALRLVAPALPVAVITAHATAGLCRGYPARERRRIPGETGERPTG